MTDKTEHTAHLLDYWRILVKRRWVVFTSVAVLFTTVTLGSLLLQPVYKATCRLQIERNAPNVLPFDQLVGPVPDYMNDFYQTQIGLIRSRHVAQEVIRSLGLERKPEFELPAAPEGEEGLSEKERQAILVDIFLSRLEVAPVRSSRLVDVTFSSGDPELAAGVANRVAEAYIAFNSEAQYNTTERASASLEHQIATLQEEIERKERELQDYARENEIIPLDEKQNITVKRLNDLNDAFVRAQAERIEREARFAALRDTSPDGIPEVLGNRLVQELTGKSADLARQHAELSVKYGDDWPELRRLRSEMAAVDARLARERTALYDQVLGSAESAYRSSVKEEEHLRETVERLKRETQELGIREIEYDNLKLAVQNRRSTLDALLRRLTETQSTAGLNEVVSSNVRIVDEAEVPRAPASPRVALNMLLSLLAGFGLGVTLVFFFEYMDKSVKDPGELQRLGLASIGMVPSHGRHSSRLRLVSGAEPGGETARSSVDQVCLKEPKSSAAEAFREARTALLVSRPGGPPRVILVTSPQPGEGKTAVALNLSVTLAQMGKRVLLVDGDMRKPRLEKILGTGNEMGLSTVLSSTGRPELPILATAVPNLEFLPSGPIPPNAADLLDSDRLAELTASFGSEKYDHVVIDSPPVLAVADPVIVASRVDSVILVVRAGITSRDAVREALHRLGQVKAHVAGGILNGLDTSSTGYYGRYYYRRYYGEPEAENGRREPASKRRIRRAE